MLFFLTLLNQFLNTTIMINIEKKLINNKALKRKILTALSKIKIDVKGELKFNKSGEATFRVVGRIIELPLGDMNYRILLEAVINARKEFDFNEWNSFDGHNSTYRIILMDNDNTRLVMTPEFYEEITTVLHNNTIVC
jgi:hypothetical protein|tara:strand:- start:339 stop:752 length:414 start_codon:yes stop_codon:yes gene_type:complete